MCLQNQEDGELWRHGELHGALEHFGEELADEIGMIEGTCLEGVQLGNCVWMIR